MVGEVRPAVQYDNILYSSCSEEDDRDTRGDMNIVRGGVVEGNSRSRSVASS